MEDGKYMNSLSQTSKPRSVNVALETVLQFDNQDDVRFIDTIQDFLNKLKRTIARHRALDNEDFKHIEYDTPAPNVKKPFKFTDFLAQVVSVLRSYNDADLSKFFRTLSTEVKAWQKQNKAFDISYKLGFRRLVDDKVNTLKISPIHKLRSTLDDLYEELHNSASTKNDSFVTSFLNYLYRKESKAKLYEFIRNLKIYRSTTRRRDNELKRIIRSGIETLVEPLLKLNADSIGGLRTVYFKYINNYTAREPNNDKTSQQTENIVRPYILRENKNINKSIREPIISHEINNKAFKITKENKVLDYIEEQRKVIKKHIATKRHATKSKLKSNAKKFKPTDTTKKKLKYTNTDTVKRYIYTTKYNKKEKTEPNLSSSEAVTMKQRKKKIPRQTTAKTTANEDTSISESSSEDKELVDDKDKDNGISEPVLIHIGSTDESKSDSTNEEEPVIQTTTTTRTPIQKRHKKVTRRPVRTEKTNNNVKRTKKSRKLFKATTLSEGLSIENFESLGFYRKNNENDTFSQIVVNTTPDDQTSEGLRSFTKEIRRRDNLNRGNEEYGEPDNDKGKTVAEMIKSKTQDTKNTDSKAVTESIKISGNIVLVNPTKVNKHNKIEEITSKPVNIIRTKTFHNISIVSRHVDMKEMKPQIVLRSEVSNETAVTTLTTPTSKILEMTPTTVQTATGSNNFTEAETETISNLNNDDRLENEVDSVMINNTTNSAFDSYLKEFDKTGDNKRIHEQMRADLEKIMAPTTAQRSVTELFTDPFDDLDNADI